MRVEYEIISSAQPTPILAGIVEAADPDLVCKELARTWVYGEGLAFGAEVAICARPAGGLPYPPYRPYDPDPVGFGRMRERLVALLGGRHGL